MQPEKSKISDKDIEYTEKILLKEGETFDFERRNFIKNNDTIDLQAVPGSGKTTALLAKLLILEKYMPLKDGSGILVVSHTNKAVDEIKKRIGKYCPKLFAYPNFVGTIQSFVDQYLAIPYYCNCIKKKPYRIDDATYNERIEYLYLELNQGLKSWLGNQNDPVVFLKKIRFNVNKELVPEINKNPSDFKLKNKTTQTYKSLVTIKNNLLKGGYLHFDDAYFLAQRYLKYSPIIKKLLQKRFCYVFVDEMQDMDVHQYNLLEDLFYVEKNQWPVYQRIGDKNQAIFSGEVRIGNVWKDRKKILNLKGSYRLSPNIANAVKYFGIEFLEIEGRNDKTDIKPHIIIFDEKTKSEVLRKFVEIIEQFQKEKKIPITLKYPFKAIAWRKIQDDRDKLGLKDYFENFKENKHNPKEDYTNLYIYLRFYRKKEVKTLRYIRKNIFNALLKILRIEKIYDQNSRSYTVVKLKNFLKDIEDKRVYEDFKLNLYYWCRGVYEGNIDNVYLEIKEFIPKFLKFFKIVKINDNTKHFIEDRDNTVGELKKSTLKNDSNIISYKNIQIKVGTVHSVKGETHTATLYMETYYNKDGRGENAKSYESQRLYKQFSCNRLNGNEGNRIKQSAKVAYVGFSRPTHLLCFAVHKNRFKQENFDNKWKVCELLEKQNEK